MISSCVQYQLKKYFLRCGRYKENFTNTSFYNCCLKYSMMYVVLLFCLYLEKSSEKSLSCILLSNEHIVFFCQIWSFSNSDSGFLQNVWKHYLSCILAQNCFRVFTVFGAGFYGGIVHYVKHVNVNHLWIQCLGCKMVLKWEDIKP